MLEPTHQFLQKKKGLGSYELTLYGLPINLQLATRLGLNLDQLQCTVV